jgi:hypothetical protein
VPHARCRQENTACCEGYGGNTAAACLPPHSDVRHHPSTPHLQPNRPTVTGAATHWPAAPPQVVHGNGTIAVPLYTAQPMQPPAWLARADTYFLNITYGGATVPVSILLGYGHTTRTAFCMVAAPQWQYAAVCDVMDVMPALQVALQELALDT